MALVTVGGLGAYNIVHGLSGDTAAASDDSSATAAAAAPAPQSTAPPSGPTALKAAQAFLDAWRAGPSQYPAAAKLTDAASNAQTDLTGYRSGLKLSSIAFSDVAAGGPSTVDPGATTVNLTVTAQVAGGTWTYPDTLNLVRSGGQVSVDWASATLYPKLLAGQSLLAGPVSAAAAPATTVTAADGTVLTAAAYPSLAGVIKTLSQGSTAGSTGTAPNGVQIVDASGSPVSVLKTFGSGPTGPKVVTTIDAKLQRVAENAVVKPVLGGLPAAVVVLDSSNGHILASAYGNSTVGDLALELPSPPGSTMKIITSAALFDMAGLYPNYPAPCNKNQPADSQTFSNESDVPSNPNTTIEQAFAESCNTAFIKDGFDKLVHPGDASDLSTEAHDVFGLGQWNIGGGLQVATPQVLAQPNGSDAAADLIGQGSVEMTPLHMASVAATVADGAFHQPVILPGLSPAGAAQPFNQTTAQYLRQMMEFDASNPMGTAEPRLGSLPGSGGKTGTAQVGDGNTTNGWFTAFDHGIAVAAMVEGGANGVDTAGYIVQQVLESGE
ncbi:penicillin-binding transpeptidase domain-containing protein [Streptacidiphilus sp. P02-A3a]|uniref:penicillin-binding transpeptidase domain-containing protein n=1 Tax=Streptacidiphilus sp. P02-A3a TaxID=2704468 RepID=UPI001CDC429D|nr:penicillin-binding transpeptidase domain-containing protein [Streptacidiphilus sp. P02-A3a]